jgi:hypothetical protein
VKGEGDWGYIFCGAERRQFLLKNEKQFVSKQTSSVSSSGAEDSAFMSPLAEGERERQPPYA